MTTQPNLMVLLTVYGSQSNIFPLLCKISTRTMKRGRTKREPQKRELYTAHQFSHFPWCRKGCQTKLQTKFQKYNCSFKLTVTAHCLGPFLVAARIYINVVQRLNKVLSKYREDSNKYLNIIVVFDSNMKNKKNNN